LKRPRHDVPSWSSPDLEEGMGEHWMWTQRH
jgi:hypothetical protein